jgi:EmrB/QacA subfamily drug resistance transporter
VAIDATILATAVPAIVSDLGGFSQFPWLFSVYLLAQAVSVPVYGKFADLVGRRPVMLVGIALFLAGSVLCGAAWSMPVLIAARVVQGLGAGAVLPMSMTILGDLYSVAERAKVQGYVASVWGVASVVGPTLGGVFSEYASWRWIFFVNIPVGLLAFLFATRFVPESRGPERRGFDLLGAFSVTSGLIVLVYAIVKVQEYGWVSVRTIGLLAVALALLAGFVITELRSRHPLVRLGIFRMRSLTVANAVMLSVGGGMFAIFFFATLYVQQILHLSPVQAGLGFLPLTAAIIIASGIAQQAIGPRISVIPVAVVGMAMAALGLILLSRVSADGSYLSDVLPGILVMGLGLGFTFVPLTLIATTNVAVDDAGLASGLFNTSQQVGGALGLAILSTIAANRTADRLAAGRGSAATPHEHAQALVSGFHVGFLAGAGLMALGVVLVAVLVRARHVAGITAAEPAIAAA